MQHLDEGTIHAWLDGALDAEEAARVEQHAAECATCAAAVAEARGLVAGASRILTALDHTPGGVIPRTAPAASGASFSARRTASLWNTLRLTPARAAAAAVIVLAAGSALVLRYRPNEPAARVRLVTAERGPVTAGRAVPGPVPASPLPAPTSADSVATAPKVAAVPPSVAGKAGNAAVGGTVAGEAKAIRAQPARDVAARQEVAARAQTPLQVAAADSALKASASAFGRLDSASTTRKQTAAENTAKTLAVTASSTASGAEAPAPAPMARRAAAAPMAAPPTAESYAGCYVVIADSSAGLPQRLSLDTVRVLQPQLLQRAPAADAAISDRFTVSTLSGTTRRPLEPATWEVRFNRALRLSIGAPERIVDLRSQSGVLVGSMNVGDRLVPVTLQRAYCGSR